MLRRPPPNAAGWSARSRGRRSRRVGSRLSSGSRAKDSASGAGRVPRQTQDGAATRSPQLRNRRFFGWGGKVGYWFWVISRRAASEFPNDNPELHDGLVWVCPEPRG